MYSVDEGKTTKEMAFKYKKNAEGIRILYPESAKIYDDLYKVFIINLRQKEGVLKMSINKNETYVGQSYKFTVGKYIGKGGMVRYLKQILRISKVKKSM